MFVRFNEINTEFTERCCAGFAEGHRNAVLHGHHFLLLQVSHDVQLVCASYPMIQQSRLSSMARLRQLTYKNKVKVNQIYIK